MISMTRIPVPNWAPKSIVQTEGELGQEAKAAIKPLLPRILQELDRRINEFANDPDQCFEDGDDFPVQSKLDGRYYVATETHEGNEDDDCYRLLLEVRCLEKGQSSKEGADYLGLEAIVTVDLDGEDFEFDEGFNVSSV